MCRGEGASKGAGLADRPITMVVPFAPGGVYDTLGRVYAAGLSEILGQQVIVENVPGAGGMTGATRVARADPDGYQFLFGGESPNAQVQLLHKARPMTAPAISLPSRWSPNSPWSSPPAAAFRPATSRIHRLRESEPGQDAIRLARHRQRLASACALFERRDRRQGHPRSLSRAWPGDAGFARRPHRLHVSDDHDRHGADRGAPGQAPAVLGRERSPGLPDIADRRGAGAQRISKPMAGMPCSCPRQRRRRSSTSSMLRRWRPWMSPRYSGVCANSARRAAAGPSLAAISAELRRSRDQEWGAAVKAAGLTAE